MIIPTDKYNCDGLRLSARYRQDLRDLFGMTIAKMDASPVRCNAIAVGPIFGDLADERVWPITRLEVSSEERNRRTRKSAP